MGNGAAVKAGARAATGDVLVFMDADGQHQPEDIPGLLEKLDQGYDMVVGARGKGSQASMHRGLANRLYNKLATWMVGKKVEDLTSGFRAVRRQEIPAVSLSPPQWLFLSDDDYHEFFQGWLSCCLCADSCAQANR